MKYRPLNKKEETKVMFVMSFFDPVNGWPLLIECFYYKIKYGAVGWFELKTTTVLRYLFEKNGKDFYKIKLQSHKRISADSGVYHVEFTSGSKSGDLLVDYQNHSSMCFSVSEVPKTQRS